MSYKYLNQERIDFFKKISIIFTIITFISVIANYGLNLYLTSDLITQTIQLVLNFSLPLVICIGICLYGVENISKKWIMVAYAYFIFVTLMNFLATSFYDDPQHLWAVCYCAFPLLGKMQIICNVIEVTLLIFRRYLKIVDIMAMTDFIVGLGGLLYFIYIGDSIYMSHYLISHILLAFIILFIYPDRGLTDIFCYDIALSKASALLLAGISILIPAVSFLVFQVVKPFFFGTSVIFLFIIALAIVLAFVWIFTLFYIRKLNDIEFKLMDENAELRIKEAEAKSKYQQKLLVEVHHRIRNNLQLIISLLNIQKKLIRQDHTTLSALDDVQNRMLSLSLVYGNVYEESDFTEINTNQYLQDLFTEISRKFKNNKISLNLDTNGLSFNLDTIIPLALIIGECISNTFKHAFSDDQEGTISISLKELGKDTYELIVSDNGAGCSMDKVTALSSMGQIMINLLVDQLDGSISYEVENGFKTIIVFKKIKTAEIIQ